MSYAIRRVSGRFATAGAIFIVLMLLLARSAFANPASDRAFSDCATAAAAYLEVRGFQIGAITVVQREAHQHRLHIAAAEPHAEPAAVICSSNRYGTAIEVASMRQVASDSRYFGPRAAGK